MFPPTKNSSRHKGRTAGENDTKRVLHHPRARRIVWMSLSSKSTEFAVSVVVVTVGGAAGNPAREVSMASVVISRGPSAAHTVHRQPVYCWASPYMCGIILLVSLRACVRASVGT